MVRIAGPALPYDRTYHLLGRFDKIRARVRAERPDVLEAHSPYLGDRGGAWRAGRTASRDPDRVLARRPRRGVPRAAHRAALARAARRPLRRGALLAPFDATFVAGWRRLASSGRSA